LAHGRDESLGHPTRIKLLGPLMAGAVLLLARGAGEGVDAAYTVNGHGLRLQCSGGHGPTVIFEPGIGGDHSLRPIAERVRDRAYACVHDRWGVGDDPTRRVSSPLATTSLTCTS
jgi:hypothetical protein